MADETSELKAAPQAGATAGTAAATATTTAAATVAAAAAAGLPNDVARLQIGETVSVKNYGNAVVVAGPITEPGQFYGRYQVRYPDGKLYHARPNALRRFEKPPARVLVCETTDHYRAAAQTYCHPNDVVLEVGSSYGITCDLIHQRGAQVVGVDKSWELVKESRAKFPHMRFEVLDAFDLEALKALSPTGNFDKICIDIGGIAELHTVMSVLGLYFREFKHSTVLIVKSKYLKTFLGHAQMYVPPLEQQSKQQRQGKVQNHPQEQQQQDQQQHKQQNVVEFHHVEPGHQLGVEQLETLSRDGQRSGTTNCNCSEC